MTERYSAPDIGSVPGSFVAEHAFALTGVRKIVTPNNRTLTCNAWDDHIAVEDSTQPQFSFRATAETKKLPAEVAGGVERIGRVMSFGVRTAYRRPFGLHTERHPDLYAGVLFDRAVEYFDAQDPLTHVRGVWSRRRSTGNTNYKAFQAALKGIPNPTAEQEDSAALATWTGRQAVKHGFTKVVSVDATPGLVVAQFAR